MWGKIQTFLSQLHIALEHSYTHVAFIVSMFETWTTSKMEATELFAVAAGLGIVAHLCFFRRFEVDTHPLLIAVCFSAAPSAVRETLSTYFQQYAHITTRTSVVTVGCFVLSLWTSMLLYRAFFHPLKTFPGPRPAKLSKIWAFVQTAKTGLKWYQVDEALHQEYGDYVRTGLFLSQLSAR